MTATAAAGVDAALDRIARHNPRLNALATVRDEDARREASALDDVPDAVGGALAGAPFSIKENIDVGGEATTEGWRGAQDRVAPRDAAVVRRMRDAGGIAIGRGNMSEFGMRWDTDNTLFGRTANPWGESLSAGGSSGGDAVAVATGMARIGLGNDFGGSVRLPAFAAGVCGLRPSVGVLPRGAVTTPVSPTLQRFSVNGVLARSVEDLAAALGALRGPEASDPVSIEGLHDPGVAGLPRRVAVVRWGREDPAVDGGVRRAAAALAAAGYDVDEVDPPSLERIGTVWRRLACTDIAITLDPATLPAPLGEPTARFLRDSIDVTGVYDSVAEYHAAWSWNVVAQAEWAAFQQRHPYVLGPVYAGRVPERDYDLAHAGVSAHEAARDVGVRLWLTVAANFLGLPAVAVPSGLDEGGLPTGVQVIGPRHRDVAALAVAADIERALGPLTPPGIEL